MASLPEIRAALLALLSSVPGIGQVHDYERYAARIDDLRELYFDRTQQRLTGGFFFREATGERDLFNTEVRRLHRWRFILFRALDDADASGKQLDQVIEALAAALRADRTLGGRVIDMKDLAEAAAGLQVERIEPVMFAGVLCHRATLSLITEVTEPLI